MGAIFGGISLSPSKGLPLIEDAAGLYDQFVFQNKRVYFDEYINVYVFQHKIKGEPFDDGLIHEDDIVVAITGIIDIEHKESKARYVYEQYREHGYDFIKDTDGDFAFVIYDKTQKKIIVSRDHVGKVMLYYTIYKDCFYFSTLINPLLSVRKNDNSIDQKWAATFACMDVSLHNIQDEVTIYKDIFMVKVAHILEVTQIGITKTCFWNPRELEVKHHWSKADYLKKFDEVFAEAVERRIQSVGNVGVSLSGGLDSTTVFTYAATLLNKQNKIIYAYSSIPSEDYRKNYPDDCAANESRYIDQITKNYLNVRHRYTASEQYNSYSIMDRALSFLELPYKYIENCPYMLDIVELASKDGCNILLTGGHGNLTISRGSITAHLFDLARQFRFIKLYRDMTNYCRYYHVGRKHFLMYCLRLFKTNILRRRSFPFSNKLILRDVRKRHRIDKEVKKKFPYFGAFMSNLRCREFMINSSIFNQLAELETKLSMETGVLTRDPTRDRRLIEFLWELPDDAFCSNGIERSLVLDAMIDRLPNEILKNYENRGVQSADWIMKLENDWDKILVEVSRLLNDKEALTYIDKDVVCKTLGKLPILNYKDCDFLDVKRLMIILVLEKHEMLFRKRKGGKEMRETWVEPTMTLLNVADTEFGDPGLGTDGGVWTITKPNGATKNLPAGAGS